MEVNNVLIVDSSEIYSFVKKAEKEFISYIESDTSDKKDNLQSLFSISSKNIESYLDFVEKEDPESIHTFLIMELCTLKVDFDEFKFDEMSDYDFAQSFLEIYGHNIIDDDKYVINLPEILDEIVLEVFFNSLVDVGLEYGIFKQEEGVVNLTPEKAV